VIAFGRNYRFLPVKRPFTRPARKLLGRKGVPHSVAGNRRFRIEQNLKQMEVMSILKRSLILAGCVAALGLGTVTLMAGRGGGGGGGAGGFGGGGGGAGGFGGGGGFGNPQAQLDTYRQAMAVTDDAEWSAISAAITKVTTARTAAMGGFGGRGGRGRGGAGGPGGAPAAAPAATPLSEAIAALQALVDAKGPTADIKAAIAKVEGIRKDNQAAYEKAQDDLRKLLKAPQEGYLVCQGVL
jgi:hypothetical protein